MVGGVENQRVRLRTRREVNTTVDETNSIAIRIIKVRLTDFTGYTTSVREKQIPRLRRPRGTTSIGINLKLQEAAIGCVVRQPSALNRDAAHRSASAGPTIWCNLKKSITSISVEVCFIA